MRNERRKLKRQILVLECAMKGEICPQQLHHLKKRKRYNDRKCKRLFKEGLSKAKQAAHLEEYSSPLLKPKCKSTAQHTELVKDNIIRKESRHLLDKSDFKASTAIRFGKIIKQQKTDDAYKDIESPTNQEIFQYKHKIVFK